MEVLRLYLVFPNQEVHSSPGKHSRFDNTINWLPTHGLYVYIGKMNADVMKGSCVDALELLKFTIEVKKNCRTH